MHNPLILILGTEGHLLDFQDIPEVQSSSLTGNIIVTNRIAFVRTFCALSLMKRGVTTCGGLILTRWQAARKSKTQWWISWFQQHHLKQVQRWSRAWERRQGGDVENTRRKEGGAKGLSITVTTANVKSSTNFISPLFTWGISVVRRSSKTPRWNCWFQQRPLKEVCN